MRALVAAGAAGADAGPPPVEYTEAVRRYLAAAMLTPESRRVYLISLTGWAWPLAGQQAPVGARRRGATPPLIPLALLGDPGTGARLAAAVAHRAATAGPRTVNRELSALRSAIGWWLARRWITADPLAGQPNQADPPAAPPPLRPGQVDSLFRATPSLREHAFWRVLYDTGAPADDVLALNVTDLGSRHRGPVPGPRNGGSLRWSEGTGALLCWLTAGRPDGPVFLTSRRAPAGTRPPDVCPVTSRARMSYRRAAEIFTEVTRPLDPAGRGWTLQQLRHAGHAAQPRG